MKTIRARVEALDWDSVAESHDVIEALCREVREEALEEAALHLEGKHRRDGMNCETRARIPAEGTTTDVFGSTCGNCSRAEFVRALKGKP